MGPLDPVSLALLVTTALLAGFIDSIAGGGGLLTLPALALAGLDPISAVATNKLQGAFGSGSATLAFARAGHLEAKTIWPLMAASGGGSVVGALLLSHVPLGFAHMVLPVVLVAVAVYFSFSPALADRDARQRLSRSAFTIFVAPAIGCYDGVFGPGAGSFFMLGFVELLGYAAVRAAAHTRAVNFASNFAALIIFSLSGHILWPAGLAMGGAQFVGARLGAGATMRNGARVVKPLLVTMCVVMAVRLAWSSWA